MLRGDEKILEIQALPPTPSRVREEVEREADCLPIPVGEDHLECRRRPETVTQQILVWRDYRVGFALVNGELADERQASAPGL